MEATRLTRRTLLRSAAAATLAGAPFVRGAHAAGKLSVAVWDHWVPGADPAPWGRGVDLGGRAFGVLFLVSLTGAVIEGGSLGWQAPLVEGGLLLSVVARIGFLTVEMRSQAPMVRLSLFHNSNFSAAMAIGFIISLTMFGLVFLLSLYFSQAGS